MAASTLNVKYEKACAVIRLCGAIDNELIFALCDEIELAIDYYQYKKIDIQIDSPGGEINSLDFYFAMLDKWVKRNVIIGTLGLTNVCSAAAIILSLGTVGYRRAYSSTNILYHNSRAIINQQVFTKESISKLSKHLSSIDKRLLDRLTSHIYKGKLNNKKDKRDSLKSIVVDHQEKYYKLVGNNCKDIQPGFLKKEYTKLNNLEVNIDVETAINLLLLDYSQENFENIGLERKFTEL